MKKIKVLHLITHLGFGGASDNTLLTVKDLPRSRYEVHLAAGEDYLDWVERGKEFADAFFLFPDLCRSPRPLADLRLLGQLTAFMREQKYDIVHTHNAKAGIIGRIAAHRAQTPIILHTFHLLSWQDANSLAGSPRHKLLIKAKEWFYFQLERYSASLSDAIVTVSENNKKEAIAQKLAPAEKFTNIYSGIEMHRFTVDISRDDKCKSLGLDANRPVIGMIGRLSPQKAPLDFVETAQRVLQAKPEAQFLMVGDGPMAAEVQQAVGDEPRIKVLGYRDDVPEIYAILDLFVLSSLWEGLGRALTEALSVGVPVAATAVNGIPELIIHGETGLLSPPRDPAQLAKNILWLLDHPEEAKSMSRRAQERTVPVFGAKQMINQIDALYERLLVAKNYELQLVDAMQNR
jgi:glycosyltransferase involved in cell wall biosynthesis